MVFWLRQAHFELTGSDADPLVGIGVDDDVLRREVVATAVALDDVYQATERQQAAIIAAARERAAALTAQAETEAAALGETARREYESAKQRGYDAGCEQALADWYQRCAEAAADQRAIQAKLRDRLAELVVVAVEQIVRSEDPAMLFARSAATVDRIADGCAYLKVRVHPDDYDVATYEFERFAASWRERGRAVPLAVTADRQLARGDCLCESDLGIVDASLSTQLAALRSAVERALERRFIEPDEPDEVSLDDEISQDGMVEEVTDAAADYALEDLRDTFADSFADALNAEQADPALRVMQQEEA